MRCRRNDAPTPHAYNGSPPGHMQIMRCHDNKMLTTDPTNLSHPFPKPSLLPTFLLPAFALQQVKDSISAPSPTFNTEQDMKLSDVNITQLKTQQSHPNTATTTTTTTTTQSFLQQPRPTYSAGDNTSLQQNNIPAPPLPVLSVNRVYAKKNGGFVFMDV